MERDSRNQVKDEQERAFLEAQIRDQEKQNQMKEQEEEIKLQEQMMEAKRRSEIEAKYEMKLFTSRGFMLFLGLGK